MCVSAVRIISVLAVLSALAVCTRPAAAQEASADFVTPARTVPTNASVRLADAGKINLDTAQEGMRSEPGADNRTFTGKSLIVTRIPRRDYGVPKTAPLSNLSAEGENESAVAERARTPLHGFLSRLDQSLHLPLLMPSTVGNLLVDLRRKYDPRSMAQPGNLHWFFDSQNDLATGSKAQQLLACSRISQSWGICASTNARTFSVYFRDL
ncbi:MAG: hypothetical protein WBX11_13700 [Thiobacillaceae bacterium]